MSDFSISSSAHVNEPALTGLDQAAKELRLVNEELRSALKRLETSEEELQTKNQDLQGSEEELRLTNEELQAMLHQNRQQIKELADLTNDLQNLLSATDSATLLLDRRLCIVRFTPKLAKLLGIRSTDRGREIFDLRTRLSHYEGLLSELEAVLKTLIPVDREFQDGRGGYYLARVMPYRETTGRIAGVSLTLIDITSRRQTEQALTAGEERFRALATASSDVLYRMSPDWTEMQKLGGSCSRFLVETQIPCSDWLEQYIPAGEQSRVLTAIKEAIQNKAVFEMEHQIRRVDGTTGWTLSRAVPLFDDAGEIREWFGAASDITERKRGEEAGRWLSAIVQNSNDAILSKSLDGIITTWNSTAEHIFGYKEAEAVGKPITLIVPPELRQQEMHILERLRAGERIDHFETTRVRKDGTSLDVSLTISPVRDSSGKIMGASTIARDITERKRTEQALRDREEDLRWTFNLSSQVPWTADPAGNILDFSDRWISLTGRKREELLGSGWMSVPHPEDLPHMRKAWEHALRTGEPYDVEHRLCSTSGDYYWVRTRAYPRRDSFGRIVKWYGTVEDIHDRKLAQEHVQKVAEANSELEFRSREMERANQLKSEFLASMSHELRTPLHTILGFTQLLQEGIGGELTGKQARYLGHIYRDAEHLLELINGVLDISRIEAGRVELSYEPVDLSACISESITGIQGRAVAKYITLDSYAGSLPRVTADQFRLKQVLYNLLGNAIKFTPQGGHVWVETSMTGNSVNVTVADTGRGIASEDQNKIFKKFQQVGNITAGVREGTGLGLAITKELIELHGGRIWVESTPGHGSRFTFSLPFEAKRRAAGA
ncbi:MAG TPA: PAS domain S-box protein [Chthoniobacterales bacterium]|nr:PAS domain S-box protein [Chthoniobacterales bacterium]